MTNENKFTKCTTCGEEIAKSAKMCPKCGNKVKKPFYKKWWVWVIVIIVIATVASSGGGSETGTETVNSNAVTQPTETKTEEPSVKTYKHGMYKVGTDMPAGEYVIETASSTYMQISSDSSGDFSSIIANDNFKNRTIVSLEDGQYFEFNSGKAYSIEDAPTVDISGGEVQEGMYLVGKDIPAGEHKVIPTGSGYYCVSSSASHELSDIIANDNFDSEKYLTVSDGQYLQLIRCKLVLSN